MDCQEVKQILDAYALGAAEKGEAHALEEHVAECLRCWDQLSQAQRVAAALALGVPLQAARDTLRQRVLAAARRSEGRGTPRLGPLASALRPLWPIAAAALAVVAAAALALAAIAFLEMDDLRQDNDRLQQQVAATNSVMDQLRQMEAVRAAPDVKSVGLPSTPASPQAAATFYWSQSLGKGVLVCNNLKSLGPGQAYQVWLFKDDEAIAAGTLIFRQGIGHQVLDLRAVASEDIDAIGVSIEPVEGSQAPTSDMILLGAFPHDY